MNFSAVIPLYFTNPRAANGTAPKIHTHDTVPVKTSGRCQKATFAQLYFA